MSSSRLPAWFTGSGAICPLRELGASALAELQATVAARRGGGSSMAMTIKSSTTKHTNGATSTHHRVVIQYPSVLELDDINSVWVKESVSEGN